MDVARQDRRHGLVQCRQYSDHAVQHACEAGAGDGVRRGWRALSLWTVAMALWLRFCLCARYHITVLCCQLVSFQEHGHDVDLGFANASA